MGITGIYPLIRKHCPGCIKKTRLEDYRGKVLAIDAGFFMYKFCYGNEPQAHLIQFGWLYVDMVRAGIEPVFVFDGKSPEEKKATKETREKRKKETLEKVELEEQRLKKIKETVDSLPQDHEDTDVAKWQLQHQHQDLQSLKNRVIQVTPEKIKEVRELLEHMGARCLVSHGEAEGTCCVMNSQGQVYAVVTEDADVFAFGAKRLIRGVGARSNRENNMEEFDVENILRLLELDKEAIIEMALLCGTDFGTTCKIPGVGPKGAWDGIKEYRTIEAFVHQLPEAKKREMPVDFDPCPARKVFYSYLKRKEPLPDTENKPNREFDHGMISALLKGDEEEVSKWSKVLSRTGKIPPTTQTCKL